MRIRIDEGTREPEPQAEVSAESRMRPRGGPGRAKLPCVFPTPDSDCSGFSFRSFEFDLYLLCARGICASLKAVPAGLIQDILITIATRPSSIVCHPDTGREEGTKALLCVFKHEALPRVKDSRVRFCDQILAGLPRTPAKGLTRRGRAAAVPASPTYLYRHGRDGSVAGIVRPYSCMRRWRRRILDLSSSLASATSLVS